MGGQVVERKNQGRGDFEILHFEIFEGLEKISKWK